MNVMGKRIKYSNEPISLEVIRDFLPAPEELLRAVQGRSAESEASRMKAIPAKDVFKRARSRLKK